MKLVCGHVISRDALNKLTSANKYVLYVYIYGEINIDTEAFSKRIRFIPRLKCPYCPVEQNPEDARLIYF